MAMLLFENDVKMYGTETSCIGCFEWMPFENDVKMYGTETGLHFMCSFRSLRMM